MSYLDAVGKCSQGYDREKSLVFLSRSVLSATLLGHWRQQHLKGTAFRSRFLLDLAHVLGVGNDTFEDAQPAILMDDFTPTEENRHFNAVSILKESLDMPDLGLEIVVVGLRTNLDFLDLHYGLAFLGLLLLFLRLVLELAVVHHTTDRRIGRSGDFHQIKTVFLGHGNGFITAQNTKLFPFGADYPQFTGTNLFVPAHAVLGYIPTRLCIKRSDSSSLHV